MELRENEQLTQSSIWCAQNTKLQKIIVVYYQTVKSEDKLYWNYYLKKSKTKLI
jgi:hypothetical protein